MKSKEKKEKKIKKIHKNQHPFFCGMVSAEYGMLEEMHQEVPFSEILKRRKGEEGSVRKLRMKSKIFSMDDCIRLVDTAVLQYTKE